MTSKLIAAITIGAFCSPTLAQSAFQGFYGQVATGYEANNASGLNGTAVTAPGGVETPAILQPLIKALEALHWSWVWATTFP